jgi:hypothetical protein
MPPAPPVNIDLWEGTTLKDPHAWKNKTSHRIPQIPPEIDATEPEKSLLKFFLKSHKDWTDLKTNNPVKLRGVVDKNGVHQTLLLEDQSSI